MLHIIPAYGRDYSSKRAVVEHLAARKDFKIADMSSRWNGSYVGVPDIWLEGDSVQVRYGRLRKVAIVKRTEVDRAEARLAREHERDPGRKDLESDRMRAEFHCLFGWYPDPEELEEYRETAEHNPAGVAEALEAAREEEAS
jgi:hypothetical protein